MTELLLFIATWQTLTLDGIHNSCGVPWLVEVWRTLGELEPQVMKTRQDSVLVLALESTQDHAPALLGKGANFFEKLDGLMQN